MNILHVPHAYWPVVGGAEHHVRRLSEELQNLGHEVSIVTTNVSSVNGYFDFRVPRIAQGAAYINGVSITRFGYGGRVTRLIGKWLAYCPWERLQLALTGRIWGRLQETFFKNLSEVIRTTSPAVVMAMPHTLPNVVSAVQAATMHNVPLVLVPLLHERDPNWDRKYVSQLLARADAIVTNTEVEKEAIVTHYGQTRDKVFIGYLGVDIDPLRQAKRCRRSSRILFLGRQSMGKGLDLLISAMTQVWDSRPDVELVIAGAADTGTQHIKELLRSLPVSQQRNASVLTGVTEEEKHRLLATSCCLVLPSEIESFGLVLLEAWSHATPVVALELPVFQEVVQHGSDGYLVPPNDCSALSNMIIHLLDSGDVARNMGDAGFQKVQRKFTWQQVAERYVCAYRYAIESKTARTR